MKIVSNGFKEQVNSFGRQLDTIITYGNTTLTRDNIFNINPNFHTNVMETLMKSMIVETDTLIPIGTRINVQSGVKIGNSYEYVDYGYYTVKEYEEDKNKKSYTMKCYDDMMLTMVDYDLQVTYPISIKNLLTAICTHFGFTLNTFTFVNDDNMITTDVFSGIGMTYRDVLSEIAIATCSTIEIENGVMYLRYPTTTGVTINEDILNDENVSISEKYGPVNRLVLTRISGADTELRENAISIEEDGLTELKISDRQIFSTEQTRDNLIDEMWDYLNGFQYYLCNLDTQGLMYLEATDRFNISIGNDTYSTIAFNDETNISDGLNEEIFNNKPIINENEYRYTKTEDKRVKNAYIEVDKQNAVITSVAEEVTEQNSKISTITQRVDEIDSKIQEIADITISGETSYATFTLNNVNESEPIEIRVRPINENISYLYPNSALYPSANTYLKVRKIRFHNNTTNVDVDYVLPADLLIYDSTHYDEFYLNYDSQTCQITKRCKYNADGSVSLLPSEQVITYDYPSIILADGDYTLSLLGYQYGYLFMRLMAKNIYTSQFYTKAETDSRINQKANEIEIGVSQTLSNYSTTTQMNAAINVKADQINSVVATKVGNEEVISKINQSAEQVGISANKINIAGVITAINNNTSTTIDGNKITTGSITSSQISANAITTEKIQANAITSSKVSSDIITTTNFSAQNINADKITSGTLNVDRIKANSISANKIVDNSITNGKIANSTITGGKIANATITDTNIASLNANKITAGTINASNVTITNLNADNITAGTLNVNRIPTLNANKINGGTIKGVSIAIGSYFKVSSTGIAELTTSAGFLTMGTTSHPYVSGINVGNSGIVLCTGINQDSIGEKIASIFLDSYNDGQNRCLRINPGGRFYIDNKYGLTGKVRFVSDSGKPFHLAFYKGILSYAGWNEPSGYNWLIT